MKEKIVFYGKDQYNIDLHKLFGKEYEDRLFRFKPLIKHDAYENYATISSSPCGYITYGRYLIPILIAFQDEEKLESYHENTVDFLFKYIDILSGICFECLDRSNYGNIIIGEGILHSLSYEDLIPILYHEIGHLVVPSFMKETDADRFATAHVGSERLIDALTNFAKFRYSFKKAMIESLVDANNGNIERIMDIFLAIALSEDSAIHFYREEYIKKCKVINELPRMKLYLNENVIKECKEKENI